MSFVFDFKCLLGIKNFNIYVYIVEMKYKIMVLSITVHLTQNNEPDCKISQIFCSCIKILIKKSPWVRAHFAGDLLLLHVCTMTSESLMMFMM